MIDVAPDIILRCKKGDQRAYAEVYRLCYSFMLSIAKRYVHDHEEAVFQMNTGFATAMCKIKKYDGSAAFGGWLRRVLVNSLIDFLRKRKRYHQHLEEYQSSKDQELVKVINSGQDKLEFQDLLELLDILPEVTRDVFNLYIIDGYKHQEISQMLDMSTGTTKWHVARARKMLSEFIGSHSELRTIYQSDERLKKNAL